MVMSASKATVKALEFRSLRMRIDICMPIALASHKPKREDTKILRQPWKHPAWLVLVVLASRKPPLEGGKLFGGVIALGHLNPVCRSKLGLARRRYKCSKPTRHHPGKLGTLSLLDS